MTALTIDPPDAPPEADAVARMLDGARTARTAVSKMLGPDYGFELVQAPHAEAVTSFLGYLMFTAQLANGIHPRSAVDFVPGEDRGSELARGFLTAGTVEVCCDYCAQLMATAMAAAAASQMQAIHGHDHAPAQWDNLTGALNGQPAS